MVGRLFTIGLITAVLLIVYLLINIVHLIWVYANPEGFWSFQYFTDLLRTALFVLILVVFTLGFLGYLSWSIYLTILSFFKAEIERPNLLKVLGIGVGYLLAMVINWVWVMGFSIYLNKNMADKYSYIAQSERLMNEGKYEEALDSAIDAYSKTQDGNRGVSQIFVLSNLYLRTGWAAEQALAEEYATTVNYAYCLQKNLQNLGEAEKLYLQALALADSGIFKEDIGYRLLPMAYLSDLYLAQGRYDEAEAYFSSILSMGSQAKGDDIMHIIYPQLLFSKYARKVGDEKRAAQLQVDILDVWEKNGQSLESITYLGIVLAAAISELELGHLDRAGKLIVTAQDLANKRKSKEIYLKYLEVKGAYCVVAASEGEGNEEVIENSFFEKLIYRISDDRSTREKFAAEALECFSLIVDETESRVGEHSPAYAESLVKLGTLHNYFSNFSESQALYSRALKILEKTKENNQQSYYSALLYSLIADYYANDHKNISSSIEQIEQFYFNKLSANYLFLTEEERELYISATETNINLINSIFVKLNRDGFKQKLYDNVLATKSIALFSSLYLRNFVANDHNHLYSEYRNIINEKVKLEQLGENANIQLVIEKENDLKLKEKNILKKISSNPSFKPFNPREVQWTDIKSALKANETAIEIINVPANPYAKDSIEYFALVTKNTYAQPELVPLFLESDLIALLNQPGNTGARINNIYHKNKESLYNKIWSPLEEHLEGSSKIYVSVSGILHKVSLPAILIDHPAEVEYLSSTRQIVTSSSTKPESKIAALFGDVEYDYLESANNVSGSRFISNIPTQANQENRFNKLAYTADEIKSIERVLKQDTRNKIELYDSDGASEEALRKLSNSNVNLLHIASHGFYFKTTTSMAASNLAMPAEVNSQYYGNSLRRSGLALAGANLNSRQNPSNDGIVTAQEISQLDLSNLDLVVLSACETGLGDIKGSEGVYGLQRAFKLAGAKSTLVSLWKVPDLQTSELMTYFYQYLETGHTKSNALRLAQIKLRNQYELPFYWAGFILIEA